MVPLLVSTWPCSWQTSALGAGGAGITILKPLFLVVTEMPELVLPVLAGVPSHQTNLGALVVLRDTVLPETKVV